MSNISINVKLLEKNNIIEKKILKGIAEDFNKFVGRKIDRIASLIRIETFSFLQRTSTYYSLVDGELAGHFGIPSANRKFNIDSILRVITNNIKVEYKPARVIGNRFSDPLKIGVVISDFSDILSLPQATIITENDDVLEWLKWLLSAGDRIIISEYEVDLRPGQGRSGLAVMIQEEAGAWRVPPEFSGTLGDNWLTRAFLSNPDAYLSIIGDIIKKEIQ